jgi:hypothetical protein
MGYTGWCLWIVPSDTGEALPFTGKYFGYPSKDNPGTVFYSYEEARNAIRKDQRSCGIYKRFKPVKLNMYRSGK